VKLPQNQIVDFIKFPSGTKNPNNRATKQNMAEEFDIVTYCESGNATAGICEVNDDLQSVKVGINSFFLIFAVRRGKPKEPHPSLCCVLSVVPNKHCRFLYVL
jgi:hypothetical protein